MPEIKFSPIRIKIPTISLKWIITVIFVVLACLFLFIIIPSARSAKKATDQFGIASGTAAGTAGGAAQILLDWDEIRNEAVEDATKVEDTKTDFITQIQKGGKLEVLSAKVTTYNIEVDGKSYASLSVNPGMVYFTVDLSSLSDNNVQVSNKKIMITLPEPEVELNFDYAKVNKVAEYKNKDIFDNLPVDNDLAV